MSSVVINGAFRPQRVTGQQRYATEISDRLLRDDATVEVTPAGAWTGSALREWAWTTVALPRLARGATLVSLTSRAPLGVRQVLVVHDLFVLTNPEWYSRRYVATHAPALRAQLARAAAVVAVSEPAAQSIRQRHDGEVTVAPNAPSDVFSRPPGAHSPSTYEHFGVRPSGYILAVGSMDPRKNLARLAAAYATLDASTRAAFPLIVVGASASIYRDAEIAWPEGARTVGYVSDEELADLYRGACAVVFASLAEGFGLPLVEAAAARAPALVVSDIPVFRWICGDGAIFVDPVSVTSIARGLRAAIEGEAPAITIELSRFDWDSSAAVVADACRRASEDAR